MKTLDRYIIRIFLLNFVILLVVAMTLFAVVDLLVNLDEFIEAGRVRADRFGGVVAATLYSIGDYYGPVVVLLYVYFSGLLVVAAMGFTLAALQRTRELTAMVSGGISLYRVAAPVLVTGIFLNALALPCQEFVIPGLAPKLARAKNQIKQDAVGQFDVAFVTDEKGRLLSAAKFDASKGRLEAITILERDELGLATRRISAEQAFWEEEHQRWRLIPEGYAVYPDSLESVPDPSVGPEPVQYLRTRLSPTVLLAHQATHYSRLLALSTLQQLQTNQAVDPIQKDRFTKIIWSRFSLLVVNVLTLVMGLPFFLLRGPANLLFQAVKTATVCLGAWGGGLVLLEVGTGVLNPVATAWLPVVIYLPLSAALLQMVKT